MNRMTRLAMGLLILKEYQKHPDVDPAHDIMELWIDEPINPDVVKFLDHIGWYKSDVPAQENRFYFFT